MTGNTNQILKMTLNVNGLNTSIKRHRLADWIKKKNPTICCLQETHLIEKDIHRLKVKGWEKSATHMDPVKTWGFPSLYQIKWTSSQN